MRFQAWMMLFVAFATVAFAEVPDDESKAIAKIEQLGGIALRDYTVPDRPVILVDLGTRSDDLDDKFLSVLASFPKLQTVNLSGARITGEGLKSIRDFKHLRTLWLNMTGLTDDGLKEVAQLTTLTYLDWLYEDHGCRLKRGGESWRPDDASSRGHRDHLRRPA